jgi:protein-arginine kinase activator protein McsA
MRTDYYVYCLFDWFGVPRYIGKGRGSRWLVHERSTDPTNWRKDEFIELTWIILGEIPKTMVRENLNEADAFAIETAFIKAIGRLDLGTGPLVNMTDGGDGASGRIVSDAERLIASERTAAQMAATPRAERIRRAKKASLAAAQKLIENPIPLEIKREQVLRAHATRKANNGYVALQGMKSIHNGVKTKKIKNGEIIPEGFILGRAPCDISRIKEGLSKETSEARKLRYERRKETMTPEKYEKISAKRIKTMAERYSKEERTEFAKRATQNVAREILRERGLKSIETAKANGKFKPQSIYTKVCAMCNCTFQTISKKQKFCCHDCAFKYRIGKLTGRPSWNKGKKTLKIECPCKVCGTIVMRSPCEARRTKGYCSRKCAWVIRKKITNGERSRLPMPMFNPFPPVV